MSRRLPDWDENEWEVLEPVRDELEALRERHRNDPPIEVLRAARADVLPAPIQEAAAAHLERSAWSRALAEGADAAETSLDPDAASRLLARVTGEAARTRSVRTAWRWAWLPALAAAAVVAVVYVVVRQPRTSNVPPPGVVQSRPVVARPPAPAFGLVLEKPDVKLTARALVLRGEGDRSKFIDDVAPALNAFRANEYATAVRTFQTLQRRYPAAVEVPFYLGISRLLLGDAPGAVAALESARDLHDETFDADSRWYLAVALERDGQIGRARAELDALCRGRNAYTARACDAAAVLKRD